MLATTSLKLFGFLSFCLSLRAATVSIFFTLVAILSSQSLFMWVSISISQQRSIFASRFDKLVRKYIPKGEITRSFCWWSPWKRIRFSYFALKLFYLQGINNVYFKCCFHCCYYCCFEFHLHSRFNWDISADECQMRSFCNKANSFFSMLRRLQT